MARFADDTIGPPVPPDRSFVPIPTPRPDQPGDIVPPPTPQLIGPGAKKYGQDMTLAALMERQKMLAAQMQAASQQPMGTIPQGLSYLANSLVDALQQRQARKAEDEGRAEVANAWATGIDPTTGELKPEAMATIMKREPDVGEDLYKTFLTLRASKAKQENWVTIPTPEGETGQWYQNTVTGETKKVGGASGTKGDSTMELRKEYNAQQPVKDYPVISNAVERIKYGASTKNAAGDMALIFGYMKLLDPNSTVREGEYATVANSGGIPDWIINQYNKAKNGQILDDPMRDSFVAQAIGQYGVWTHSMKAVNDRYGKIAGATGIDPSLVLIEPQEFKVGDDKPDPNQPPNDGSDIPDEETNVDLPPVPEGYPGGAEAWPTPQQWAYMDAGQRKLFLRWIKAKNPGGGGPR